MRYVATPTTLCNQNFLQNELKKKTFVFCQLNIKCIINHFLTPLLIDCFSIQPSQKKLKCKYVTQGTKSIDGMVRMCDRFNLIRQALTFNERIFSHSACTALFCTAGFFVSVMCHWSISDRTRNIGVCVCVCALTRPYLLPGEATN